MPRPSHKSLPRSGVLSLGLAIAAATFLSTGGSARADCTFGNGDYLIQTMGTTVQVLPESDSRTCGGPIHLLRQDVASGELVQLADYCVKGFYVDECVPPGTYRYGFATPYDCNAESGCGGVYFWETATVTADPTGCARSSGNAAPTPFSGPAPWPTNVRGLDCHRGCSCSSSNGAVLSVDGALVVISLVWGLRRRRRTA